MDYRHGGSFHFAPHHPLFSYIVVKEGATDIKDVLRTQRDTGPHLPPFPIAYCGRYYKPTRSFGFAVLLLPSLSSQWEERKPIMCRLPQELQILYISSTRENKAQCLNVMSCALGSYSLTGLNLEKKKTIGVAPS